MTGLVRLLPPKGTLWGDRLRYVATPVVNGASSLWQAMRAPFDALRMLQCWAFASHSIGSAAQGREVVMLVVSALRHDPRVRREAQTLAAAGYSITIVWPDNGPEAGQPIDWGQNIAFRPLSARAGRFANSFPGFLGMSLVSACRDMKPFGFHAHDLNTMLAGLVLGRMTGAHVVVDHHEWFSEHVTWSVMRQTYVKQRDISKRINGSLEGFAHRHASRVITVCHSIAEAMQQRFGGHTTIEVIRNIPSVVELPALAESETTGASPDLRSQLGIRTDQLLILYQGGIGPSRALEPVIEALALAPSAVLVIRGPGIDHFGEGYRAIAAKAGAEARLHLLPPVASDAVVRESRGADCGLYTVADLCKSFTYALPNKAFEYLAAGMPVLTADYPEVHRLLVDGKVGLSFDPRDPASIAGAMNRMADDATRARLCTAIPAVLAANAPKAEWQKLVALYDGLPLTGSVAATPKG